MMRLMTVFVVALFAVSMVYCGDYKPFWKSVSSSESESTASIIHGLGSAEAETETYVIGNGIADADAEAVVKSYKCYLSAEADSYAKVKYYCSKVIADAFADAFAAGYYPITDVTTFAKVKKCAAFSSAEAVAKAFPCY
eukprot:TRINITY_DN153_c0_g1_i8.p2 TRINITY_DN153_c0_g1~~TRINITY_DN153_c0_g1_i8.p2  ORF type:complete len:139 (-),score=15.58 TRINITY_DN153_c0_g1_i8:472-888(-)